MIFYFHIVGPLPCCICGTSGNISVLVQMYPRNTWQEVIEGNPFLSWKKECSDKYILYKMAQLNITGKQNGVTTLKANKVLLVQKQSITWELKLGLEVRRFLPLFLGRSPTCELWQVPFLPSFPMCQSFTFWRSVRLIPPHFQICKEFIS